MHDERQQVPEAQVGRLRVGEAAQRALHDAQPHAPDVRVDAVLPALDALRLQRGEFTVFSLFLSFTSVPLLSMSCCFVTSPVDLVCLFRPRAPSSYREGAIACSTGKARILRESNALVDAVLSSFDALQLQG